MVSPAAFRLQLWREVVCLTTAPLENIGLASVIVTMTLDDALAWCVSLAVAVISKMPVR